MTISFQLDGTDFVALNGGSRNLDGRDLGPEYRLSSSRAVSFVVSCQTQAELDDLWEKLAQGGETLQCGWLTDRYGVTWQIVPAGLGELLGDEDPEKVGRAMKAILEMEKIDINVLRAAAGQT
jgi:predicted 3-demethylubiquinone-9 3-methyltransferase (glyoxalase superfamily)